MGLFQYQALAIPLAAAATTETPHADVWAVQSCDPPRPLRRELNSHSDEAFVPLTTGAFSPASGAAWENASEPPRRASRLPIGEFAYGEGVFVKETPHADAWFQEPSDVARPLRRALYGTGDFAFGEGVFVVETPQLDKWEPLPNLPTRPLPRLTDREDFFGTFWANFATIFNPANGAAYPNASEPTRVLKRELYAHSDAGYGEGVFVVETPHLDSWWREPADVARPLRRALYGDGEFAFGEGVFNLETITVDKWIGDQKEPPRPLKRLPIGEFSFGEGIFVHETPHLDAWFQEPADVARPVRRALYALGDSAVALFATTDLHLEWLVEAADLTCPAKRLLGEPALTLLVPVFSPAVGFPYPTPDVPPRALKRVPYQLGEFGYGEGVFVQETITLDKWWAEEWMPRRVRTSDATLELAGFMVFTVAPPAAIVPRFIWTEPARGVVFSEGVRGILWQESKRAIVWSGPVPQTYVKRVLETAPFAYDFLNDAVIAPGDPIASIVSIIATVVGGTGSAPLVNGTGGSNLATGASISGTQIITPMGGGADGGKYEIEWTVKTTAGYVRNGIGYMNVNDL